MRYTLRAIVLTLCCVNGCISIKVSRGRAAEPFEPTDTARVIAPGVVSTGRQFSASLSADMRELFTVERLYRTPDGPPSLGQPQRSG